MRSHAGAAQTVRKAMRESLPWTAAEAPQGHLDLDDLRELGKAHEP
jgi:hypothetical protein